MIVNVDVECTDEEELRRWNELSHEKRLRFVSELLAAECFRRSGGAAISLMTVAREANAEAEEG